MLNPFFWKKKKSAKSQETDSAKAVLLDAAKKTIEHSMFMSTVVSCTKLSEAQEAMSRGIAEINALGEPALVSFLIRMVRPSDEHAAKGMSIMNAACIVRPAIMRPDSPRVSFTLGKYLLSDIVKDCLEHAEMTGYGISDQANKKLNFFFQVLITALTKNHLENCPEGDVIEFKVRYVPGNSFDVKEAKPEFMVYADTEALSGDSASKSVLKDELLSLSFHSYLKPLRREHALQGDRSQGDSDTL